MDKRITIHLAPHMFATLSGLAGLGCAVMQNKRDTAQGFADMLSEEGMESIAKEVIELLRDVAHDYANGPLPPKIDVVS